MNTYYIRYTNDEVDVVWETTEDLTKERIVYDVNILTVESAWRSLGDIAACGKFVGWGKTYNVNIVTREELENLAFLNAI